MRGPTVRVFLYDCGLWTPDSGLFFDIASAVRLAYPVSRGGKLSENTSSERRRTPPNSTPIDSARPVRDFSSGKLRAEIRCPGRSIRARAFASR